MKLSKTFEHKGTKLELSFDYSLSWSPEISNFSVIATDDKCNRFYLTDLFESDKELWAIADKIIDDQIKSI